MDYSFELDSATVTTRKTVVVAVWRLVRASSKLLLLLASCVASCEFLLGFCRDESVDSRGALGHHSLVSESATTADDAAVDVQTILLLRAKRMQIL